MQKTIVAIGEVLWDIFPDRRLPGGALCNVAFHATRLGDHGIIVSRVGRDELGDDVITFLRNREIDTDFMQRDDSLPTGTVAVSFERGEPRYRIADNVAWDNIAADENTRSLVARAEAICVGSLAQRSEVSRTTIHTLLSAARQDAIIVFDVNLRPPFVDLDAIIATFRMCNVVKMNEHEASRLSHLLDLSSLVPWLLEGIGVEAVCITRGEGGASLTTRHGTHAVPGVAIDEGAGDKVGAGDAFTAAMVHAMVRACRPDEVVSLANQYAALVAARSGAMPRLSDTDLISINRGRYR